MSDVESKGGSYRIEYASSGRAKCKGPKPCSGTAIEKGAMRLGSLVDMNGRKSFSWKHWGCATAKVIANLKKQMDEASELDGYDELEDDDKAKLDKAWEVGHVADEDIPDSARKPVKDGEEEEEKPKKKRAATKKKKTEDDDDEDDEEEKPKPKRAPRKKKTDDNEEEEKPKPKRAPRKKKTDDADDDEKPKKKVPAKRAPKSKKKIEDSDDDGEDFGVAMDKVSADEEDEDSTSKKRKRAPTSKPAAKKKAKKSKVEDEDEDED